MDYQTKLPDPVEPEPIEESMRYRKPTLQRQSDVTSFDYMDKDTPTIDEEYVLVLSQVDESDEFHKKGEETEIVTMTVEAEVNDQT